jgi:hypothetical protein
MTGDHDHARPDIRVQRTVLIIARSLLGNDREAAALATLAAPCPVCLAIATMQFGYALAAELAGAGFVTGPLRARLLAAIDAAQLELDVAGN